MKKRIFAALMAAAMLFSAAGCSSGSNGPDKKIQIGVIQLIAHDALDKSYKGFVQALKDGGYGEDKAEIIFQNAQGETANLSTIADQYVGKNVDLIFAIATPAAQAAAGKTPDIPIIGTAVTDFAAAGLVNSNDDPETNVSGTTDMNPIEGQLDLLFELAPDTKTVGFIYNTSEDNSQLQVGIAKKYLDEKRITYTEKTVSATNDVQQAITSLAKECDAIYIPTDNILSSSMSIVAEVTIADKIPVICGESSQVEGGALGTLGINYYNLGYQAGKMAIRVLEGEDISKMAIESSEKYDFCINGDTADAIGITIPEKYADAVIRSSAE